MVNSYAHFYRFSKYDQLTIDIHLKAPIEGVILLEGDITTTKTANRVIDYFEGDLADLVVCDGAPDGKGTPLCSLATMIRLADF